MVNVTEALIRLKVCAGDCVLTKERKGDSHNRDYDEHPTPVFSRVSLGWTWWGFLRLMHAETYQGGNEPLPLSDPSKAAWIQPPAMLPRLPNPQKTAARVPSSDCLYQEPYMKCAPTLQRC